MGDYRSVVGDADKVDGKSHDRELEDHLRCMDPVRRNRHVAAYVPRAGKLRKEYDARGDQGLDHHRSGEDTPQPVLVSLPELEGEETADRRREGVGYHREQGDKAPDGRVHPKVGLAERVEDHPGRIEPDGQQDEHAEVQSQGIPGYPPAVLGNLRGSVRVHSQSFLSGFLSLLYHSMNLPIPS